MEEKDDKILFQDDKTLVRMDKFGDTEIKAYYRRMRPPATAEELEIIKKNYNDPNVVHGGGNASYCPPFNPRTYVAQKEGNIVCMQDVACKMRDGVTIYCDIYRPDCNEQIPVIISWGFFGKRPGEGMDDWKIMGVPHGVISKMSKHESADPGFWCRHGYAIANVDIRGSGHSEGNLHLFGTRDAQDGYDFIEWLAEQRWCNGKVAMYGNSALAMVQWRIAASQPPHLAAIAPWEGTSDMYRESVYEGGIPAFDFAEWVVDRTVGTGYIDDMLKMAQEYPLMNAYWEDKIPKFENIRIPVYATACWNHFHLRGSMNAWRRIKSRKKWMRIHREFEWPDAYCPAGLNDLKAFFDRYLKDIHNGWEFTPRVRLEIMDAYDFDFQINRAENEFPLARTQYKKLYLNAADASMAFEPCPQESKASYDGNTGEADFNYRFDEDTEITGYLKLRLWVETDGHNEMDLFVNVQKLDEEGNFLPNYVLGEPHPGAWGKMRVSHRKLDRKLSTDFNPVQAHTVEEKLNPGEIVPVDIEIVPHSKLWHKGQQIRVQVAGRYIRQEGWFEKLGWTTDNKGAHIIHTGAKYDSFLQIPVIPPRYKVGDYVYR
jgi:uncharacterized protein